MSIPPDQFDENGNPIEPDESFDAEFVAYRGNDDMPEWFERSSELFYQLDNRESVFLEVNGGIGTVEKDEFGNYSLIVHGFDNDTGEDFYQEIDNWSYDELMDFYNYIYDYYDDVAFWPDGGSGDLSQI